MARFKGDYLQVKPNYRKAIEDDIRNNQPILIKKLKKDGGDRTSVIVKNDNRDWETFLKETYNPLFECNDGYTFNLTRIEKEPYSGKAKLPSGEECELLLSYHWNKMNRYDLTRYRGRHTIDKHSKKYEDVFQKLCHNLSYLQHERVMMTEVGNGALGATYCQLKEGWRGRNKTPKTDIILGSHRISMKKAGGSQLISSKRDELISTVESAMRLSKNNTSSVKSMLKDIKQYFHDNMPTGMGGFRELKKFHKEGGKLNHIQEMLIKQSLKNKELTTMFNEVLSNKDNEEFKRWFVFECATGYSKFKFDEPIANYMMEFDLSNGTMKLDRLIDESNHRYTDKIVDIANSMKVDVSFKGNNGNVYPAMKVYIPK